MWRPPKTWQPPPRRPEVVRKLDRLRMGNGPTGAQKRMAKAMRGEFEHQLELVPACEVCGLKHLGSAPVGHDLIVMTNEDKLIAVKPPQPPKASKRGGLFRTK